MRAGFDPEKDLFRSAVLQGADGEARRTFDYGEDINLVVRTNPKSKEKFGLEVRLKNSRGDILGYSSSWLDRAGTQVYEPGDTIAVGLKGAALTEDTYILDLIARMPKLYHVDNWWDGISFEVGLCKPEGSPFVLRADDQIGNVVLRDVSFRRA